MTNRVTRFRLADIFVVLATAMTLAAAAKVGLARDTSSNDSGSRSDSSSSSSSMAIVSNGLVTARIFNGPGGLEVSSNAPGVITVTSGSHSVSLRGDYVTLSGAVSLAPFATPGVQITPNEQGGYTLILDPPMEFDLGK
jgi:hypothetical protein